MKAKAIKLLVFGLLSLSALFSSAQAKKNLEYSGFFDSYYFRGPWSVTAGAGLSLYNGDLGTFFNSSKISPTFNFGVAYKPWPRVRFGFQFGIINLKADDASSRGLSMKSNMKELMFYGKYYLIEDIITKHNQFRKDKMKLIKPFVSLGFAPVIYNSTLTDSLGAETTASSVTFAVPIGGGLQFDFTHRVSLSLDLAYRYVFNDQLDAYGTEQGGGSAKDSYATVGISLQYSPFAKRSHKKKFKAPEREEQEGAEAGSSEQPGENSSETSPETNTSDTTPEEITPTEETATEEVETPTEETEVEEAPAIEEEDVQEEEEEEEEEEEYDDGW